MKTTYKVLGVFRGYQAGDEVELDLDPFIEQWAIEQGLIEAAKKPQAKKKEAAGDG